MDKNIFFKLAKIKKEIRCPKTHQSEDGKYKFRNVQDIIDALKPFEDNLNVLFYCTDEIVEISRFPYVRSTVHMVDLDNPVQEITATSSAREDIASRGMAPSQQTGAATSYARKTAFDALLGFSNDLDPDEQKPMSEDDLSPEPKTDSELKGDDKPTTLTEQSAPKNDAENPQPETKEQVQPETKAETKFVTIEEAAAVLIEYKPEAKKRGREGEPISVLSDNQLQRMTTATMVTDRTRAAAIALLSFKMAEAQKANLPRTPQEAVQVCVEYINPEDAKNFSQYAGKPLATLSDDIIKGFAKSSKVTEATKAAAQIIMSA